MTLGVTLPASLLASRWACYGGTHRTPQHDVTSLHCPCHHFAMLQLSNVPCHFVMLQLTTGQLLLPLRYAGQHLAQLGAIGRWRLLTLSCVSLSICHVSVTSSCICYFFIYNVVTTYYYTIRHLFFMWQLLRFITYRHTYPSTSTSTFSYAGWWSGTTT